VQVRILPGVPPRTEQVVNDLVFVGLDTSLFFFRHYKTRLELSVKTELEQARMKNIEETLLEFTKAITLQIDGEDIGPQHEATFIGAPLAAMDALFAIRDGEPWRDREDPREIARTILRQMGIGE